MKKTKNSLIITAVLCVFFLHLSCLDRVNDDHQSGVVLILTRIEGVNELGISSNYLASDVQTLGGYLTNPIIASLEVKHKKPQPLNPASSYKMSVVIDRYIISYTSPVGDPVPSGFEGRLTTVCEVGASVDVELVAVRAEAKAVAPLSALIGTLNVYWAVAEVRVIGHDLNGEGVEAVGYITVYFADWADP